MQANKCWHCYREIEENLESGKWKEIGGPLKSWYEVFNAEKEFIKKRLLELKPELVLEIGAGSGRIIEIILRNCDAKIVALEKNPEMHRLVLERFRGNERVEIVLSEELVGDRKFDLILCMMNTLGNQENETGILEKAMRIADKMVFTLYKKGSEKIREAIYKSRGHKDFALKDSCFYFNDKWVKGLISKSYSREDIEKICSKLDCKFKIHDLCEIAYLIELEKQISV